MRAPAPLPSAILREKLLTRQFLAQLPQGQPRMPRAVLMDWNLGGTSATLVSVDDGTVSFYMSSGGGIIGAGTHQNVARAAAPFRAQAAAIMSQLSPTATFPPPARDNNVVFYVVTDSATFTSGELDVGPQGLRPEHPLAALFNAAHELIAEIRRVTPS